MLRCVLATLLLLMLVVSLMCAALARNTKFKCELKFVLNSCFVHNSQARSRMPRPRKSAVAAAAAVKAEPQETRGSNTYLQQFDDVRTKELAVFSFLSTKQALPQLDAAIHAVCIYAYQLYAGSSSHSLVSLHVQSTPKCMH
jgi:hypothetical protein